MTSTNTTIAPPLDGGAEGSISTILANLALEKKDTATTTPTTTDSDVSASASINSFDVVADDNDAPPFTQSDGHVIFTDGISRRHSTTAAVASTTTNATTAFKQQRRASDQPRHPSGIRRLSSSGLASFSNLSNFLAEEGLMVDAKHTAKNKRLSLQKQSSGFSLMSNLSEYTDGDGIEHAPNEYSTEAVKDFALQLKFWGKEQLDEEAFNMLLDDIGYTRSRDGLFDDFLDEIALASPSFDYMERSVSVHDMKCLYMSEPYRLPQQASFNSGEALMSYVENLFRKADATGDNVLDKNELHTFLTSLFDGREPTEEEVIDAMKAFDTDGDGNIDFDEFKSFMLKANINETSEVSGE